MLLLLLGRNEEGRFLMVRCGVLVVVLKCKENLLFLRNMSVENCRLRGSHWTNHTASNELCILTG